MDRVKEQLERSAKVSSKHQITLPVRALRDAGVDVGERLTVRVEGPGRIVLERADDPVAHWAGKLTGTWEPGHLDALRDEWD